MRVLSVLSADSSVRFNGRDFTPNCASVAFMRSLVPNEKGNAKQLFVVKEDGNAGRPARSNPR